MKNENEFIEDVWNKYNLHQKNNSKDYFFQKHHYKNTDYVRKIYTLLTFLCIFIGTIGITYAGNYIYTTIIQNSSQKNISEETNYSEMYNDMTLENGRFYKKVYSYNDYLSIKERFGDIVEMSETDFNDYFVLVIILERYEEAGTYISNIGTDNDNLYVELKKYNETEEFDISNNVLSTKISKEQDRENITIDVIYEENLKPFSDEFTNLEDLPNNYTVENAISDNCFVIKGTEVISYDLNKLDNFLENTQNGKEDFIRIVISFENNSGIIIKDIEYKNGKYLICEDSTRFDDGGDDAFNTKEFQVHYFVGIEMQVNNLKNSETNEVYAKQYKIQKENKENDLIKNEYYIICNILEK